MYVNQITKHKRLRWENGSRRPGTTIYRRDRLQQLAPGQCLSRSKLAATCICRSNTMYGHYGLTYHASSSHTLRSPWLPWTKEKRPALQAREPGLHLSCSNSSCSGSCTSRKAVTNAVAVTAVAVTSTVTVRAAVKELLVTKSNVVQTRSE